jgi:hypothetical protein
MRIFWVLLVVAGLAGLSWMFLPEADETAAVVSAPPQAGATMPAQARSAPAAPAGVPTPDPEPTRVNEPEVAEQAVAAPTAEQIAGAPGEVDEPTSPATELAVAATATERADERVAETQTALADAPPPVVPAVPEETPAPASTSAGAPAPTEAELAATRDAFAGLLNFFADVTDEDAPSDEAPPEGETVIASDPEPTPASETTPTPEQSQTEMTAAAPSDTSSTEVAQADPAQPETAQPETTALAIDAVAPHADGGLDIGGRWRVPGEGTADSPYILTWEVLQSALQVYNPRLGKNDLPAWSEALAGKRVRLEGHVVLPLAQQSAKEILLTLNMWDSCCIGIPPTPYDAVEVRLTEPVGPGDAGGGVQYGAIEGTFEVDPYVAGGWLLGLYVMNDATLNVTGIR